MVVGLVIVAVVVLCVNVVLIGWVWRRSRLAEQKERAAAQALVVLIEATERVKRDEPAIAPTLGYQWAQKPDRNDGSGRTWMS